MILVPLLNPKFATRLPLGIGELRVRGTSIAAPLFAGALLAALVGGAWAQTTSVPPAGLRLTLDENGPDGQRPAWARPSRRPTVPVGVVPKFGTPPRAGAGKTGFVSSNVSS